MANRPTAIANRLQAIITNPTDGVQLAVVGTTESTTAKFTKLIKFLSPAGSSTFTKLYKLLSRQLPFV